MTYVKDTIQEINVFINETSSGIDTKDDKFKNDVKALLKIKENSQKISQKKDQTILELEVIEEALKHYHHKEKVNKKDQLETTKKLIGKMAVLQNDCSSTEAKIAPKLKEERKRTEKKLIDFEKDLKRFYIADLKKQDYVNFKTGPAESLRIVEEIEERVEQFEEQMNDFNYYTDMFEMSEGTGPSAKILKNISEEIEGMRNLWEHIRLMNNTFDEFLKMEWKDIDCGQMEDKAKGL